MKTSKIDELGLVISKLNENDLLFSDIFEVFGIDHLDAIPFFEFLVYINTIIDESGFQRIDFEELEKEENSDEVLEKIDQLNEIALNNHLIDKFGDNEQVKQLKEMMLEGIYTLEEKVGKEGKKDYHSDSILEQIKDNIHWSAK